MTYRLWTHYLRDRSAAITAGLDRKYLELTVHIKNSSRSPPSNTNMATRTVEMTDARTEYPIASVDHEDIPMNIPNETIYRKDGSMRVLPGWTTISKHGKHSSTLYGYSAYANI